MSGLLSDLLTASIAKHARALTQNSYFNGHPDLVVKGIYPDDAVKAGTEGVKIKTTRKSGGAVDSSGLPYSYQVSFRIRPSHMRWYAMGEGMPGK